jgi:ketosteroid isomerase-like protein
MRAATSVVAWRVVMESKNVETVRAYWAASERGDLEAAGRYIGNGCTWIDHTTDVVARTPEGLHAARRRRRLVG